MCMALAGNARTPSAGAQLRKTLDFTAAADRIVSDIAGTDHGERAIVLKALIDSLAGDLGTHRHDNDWLALTTVASRGTGVHYNEPDTTKPLILRELRRNLSLELDYADGTASVFAGLSAVK